MEYRRFGKSDLATPVLGLGCWGLGGEPYGPVDKETAVRAMNAAIDLGYRPRDNAEDYAEEVLAKGGAYRLWGEETWHSVK